MTAGHFALVLGVIYTIVGVLGFLPGMLSGPAADAPPMRVTEGYGDLFGVFPVNLVHSLVHLGVGLWGLIASRSWRASRTFAASVAVIFGVLTVMGLIPGLNTAFGFVPLFGHDVWLHALTALTALAAAYFGFGQPRAAGVARNAVRRAA